MHRLIAVKRLVLGPAGLALGLLAALIGAALPTGFMAYGAIVDDIQYTAISWALIAPAWGLLGALWLAARRWPLAAGLAMAPIAIFAGIYYSDVYAEYPAALLYLLAMAAISLPFLTAQEELAAASSDALPARPSAG
ncbi:MAG: hypothetical protein IIC89_02095 [Chloroflexi bacterium]|nr:hypothetical protein [Chloroflexota bacterium]